MIVISKGGFAVEIVVIVLCSILLILNFLILKAVYQNKKRSSQEEALTSTLEENRLQLQSLAESLKKLEDVVSKDLFWASIKSLREDTASLMHQLQKWSSLSRQEQSLQFENLSKTSFTTLMGLSNKLDQNMAELRNTVDQKLTLIAQQNEQRLEKMQQTVDQKLTQSIADGLDHSFKQVSTQLQQVYKSMGEVQALTSDIGDLKNILSGVKTRGTWGEVQLGNLMSDILSPEQYSQNVHLGPSNDMVEFALHIPSMDDQITYLPIDAKFPMESFTRLIQFTEEGDVVGARQERALLHRAMIEQAKKIRTKYIYPPQTTDFAVMFFPSEGLYAEAAQYGITQKLQSEQRILVASPSTLSALLSSFQIGFKSVAIEKRSADILKTLGAIQHAFSGFTILLDKTSKSLIAAQNNLKRAQGNSRTIERKLKNIEEIPTASSLSSLDFTADVSDEEETDE